MMSEIFQRIKLPQDLYTYLQRNPWTMVASFCPKGIPVIHFASLLYPRYPDSLLMGVHHGSELYKNMVWQKMITCAFYYDDEISYTLLGRAGLVSAPSLSHPLIDIFRIDIISLKRETMPLLVIEKPAVISVRKNLSREMHQAVIDEMKQKALEI